MKASATIVGVSLALLGALVSVVPACNGGAAPRSSCEVLSLCCANATGVNRTTCDSTVSVGLDSTCLAALASYEATGVCEGEDAGRVAADAADDAKESDAGSMDSDPCGELSGCCGGMQPGSQCSVAVGSKNATFCQQELESLRSAGDCGDAGN
jgi:hypothetical protein